MQQQFDGNYRGVNVLRHAPIFYTMCPFVESTSNGTKCTLKMSLLKKGLQCAALRNTNDGLCSFCNFVSFFTTIKAFSQSSSVLYYKQKTCICSRAAKPPFLLPKNCVKMRMIFFFVCRAASIVLRIQLCDCDVTYRWRNLASFLFNILTKKSGIHQCYQL